MSNRFKNSVGRYFLRQLFFETTLADKENVIYTLKLEDHEGYPSLYRLYMEIADPTEYRFATQCLDGWAHWKELTGATWFREHLEAWRDELSTRLRSDAMKALIGVAANGNNPNSYQANKYLLETHYKPAGKGRGRPGRDTSAIEENERTALLGEIKNDAIRLGIN